MTVEEARKHQEDRINEQLEEYVRNTSISAAEAELSQIRGRKKRNKSWEEFKKKMELGDMVSFLFVWTDSPIKGGMGVGWDGYVIIRGDYFLHSMTQMIYN